MGISRLKTIFSSALENCSRIFNPNEIDEVFYKVGYIKPYKDNKKIEWYDLPISFDIETSSYYNSNNEKRACMYVWTLSICGYIIMGRTWAEFVQSIEHISQFYELNEYKRMVIFVHNLAYEFQFIKDYFKWVSVFALTTRKPIFALTTLGIEFRCSYLLSGYSLANLARNIHTIKIEKLIGELDYRKIRTWLTPLSNEEKQYCINDVQIVIAYIFDLFEQGYDISSLPKQKQDLCAITQGITVFMVKNTEKTRMFL